ncbi:ExbD/TolR family protein [Marinomonas transparens]|uniref:Biopolymer transporter ExbD n=1 Tax=Marinomonas transparens TaxID=2795388 RepID=A0A934JQP7_9GAMM|nr:biopolymer transporter ExbD [Marinomonas transparens]MBJ7538053.1 biopolymer transporter ExbD [Marinomonas transparens]
MKIDQKFAAKIKNDEDNMVPLINVVFLMLVFFMVAGQIRKADPIPVIPPTSINENRPVSDPNVLIVVGTDRSIYVDDNLITLNEVKPYLEQAFETALDKDAFWVQIKGDGLLPVEELRPIFSEIRLSGLTKVSLATQLQRGQE